MGLFVGRAEGTSEEGTSDTCVGSELGENVTKGNGGIVGASDGFTVPSADVSEGAADSCVGNELTLGDNETKGKGGSVEVNVGSRVPCAEGTADISGSSEGGQNIKHKRKGKGGYVEAEAGAGDDDGRDCSAVLGAADLVTSEAFVDETRHISKRINSMQTTLKLIL